MKIIETELARLIKEEVVGSLLTLEAHTLTDAQKLKEIEYFLTNIIKALWKQEQEQS